MLGSLLIVLGAVSMATWVHDAPGACLAFGVLVGLGVAWGGPFGVQPNVVNWFVRRRALALAIVYSAGGVGGLFAARLLNRLIAAHDGNWRLGWWVYAGLALLALVIASLTIRSHPSDLGQAPDGIPEGAPGSPTPGVATAAAERPPFITREVWSFREVLHSGRFWVVILALCGGSAGYTLFLSQGIPHLKDLGYTAQQAANAVSLTTGSTLLGKVALGSVGDRIDPRFVYAATLAVLGLGLVIVLNAHGTTVLNVFPILVGLGFGGGLVCMMAVLSNYYGPKVFPAAAGMSGAANTLLSFALSQSGGQVYDLVGSYAPAFYALAAWCVIGALALCLIRPPVRSGGVAAVAVTA
jgi:MFS family permease